MLIEGRDLIPGQRALGAKKFLITMGNLIAKGERNLRSMGLGLENENLAIHICPWLLSEYKQADDYLYRWGQMPLLGEDFPEGHLSPKPIWEGEVKVSYRYFREEHRHWMALAPTNNTFLMRLSKNQIILGFEALIRKIKTELDLCGKRLRKREEESPSPDPSLSPQAYQIAIQTNQYISTANLVWEFLGNDIDLFDRQIEVIRAIARTIRYLRNNMREPIYSAFSTSDIVDELVFDFWCELTRGFWEREILEVIKGRGFQMSERAERWRSEWQDALFHS